MKLPMGSVGGPPPERQRGSSEWVIRQVFAPLKGPMSVGREYLSCRTLGSTLAPVAPRRPSRKDIRELIAAVRSGGWTVNDPIGNSNVYKAKCKCGLHLEYIHSTPSGVNYAKNKLAHMRATCWRE